MRINIQEKISLSKYTQLKIGGPAEYFVIVKSKQELLEAINYGNDKNLIITILGWGSNVLISDRGIKGLVIINRSNEIKILNEENELNILETSEDEEKTFARLDQLESSTYGDFSDLDYDESNLPTTKVIMDSGVSLPLAILKTIKSGRTGLQWYAGIPGTIGGSIYNNIHGGTHFIFEVLDEVEVWDRNENKIKFMKVNELEGGYDTSIFHKTNDYILSATFNLYKGDSQKALQVMQEWRVRKKIQPQISAGCTWMNLSEEEKIKNKLESVGAGYLIDKILKLKGMTKGGAQISTYHAAFIENIGNATSSDVLNLMKLIHSSAKEKLGIDLKPEIFLLGFDEEEIKEFKR